jgi:hypothetical protein
MAGASGVRRPSELQLLWTPNLERDSPAQLPEPWLVRTVRSTEVPVGNVVIDVGIVCPVENIEEFKSELEIYAFRNRSVFVEVSIRLKEVRPTELHCFSLPSCPKVGTAKSVFGIAPVSQDLLSVDCL